MTTDIFVCDFIFCFAIHAIDILLLVTVNCEGGRCHLQIQVGLGSKKILSLNLVRTHCYFSDLF